ncbi:MAG: hypothetical protein O7E52_18625 [Candidatus Poribacteria bacterium]|nr:hypothetical protein [Candidatus Poribacteria bacterium]
MPHCKRPENWTATRRISSVARGLVPFIEPSLSLLLKRQTESALSISHTSIAEINELVNLLEIGNHNADGAEKLM